MAEILAHPTYPDTIFKLTPNKKGKLSVAEKRGGPFNIDWEVHGKGDIKLVVCNTSSSQIWYKVDLSRDIYESIICSFLVYFGWKFIGSAFLSVYNCTLPSADAK